MDVIALILVLIFIFGLAIGSFLNVLIYRLNVLDVVHLRGVSPRLRRGPQSASWRTSHLGGVSRLFGGRSFCPKCKRKISWHDNIPLLSFILLRGRCRFCHSPISWQYPLVELATGVVTVFVVFHLRGVPQAQHHLGGVLFQLIMVYALIVIFVSDLRYQIIPDKIVYPAILISLIYNFLLSSTWKESIRPPSRCLLVCLPPSEVFFVGALISGFSATTLFFLLYLLTRGKGMGLGDVKLAALMGLFLGFPKIIVALYLAFLTGAIVSVILMISGKKKLSSHIPFGPFLTGATIISFFFGEIIWGEIIRVLL